MLRIALVLVSRKGSWCEIISIESCVDVLSVAACTLLEIWTAVVREYFLSVSYKNPFTRLENVLKNVLHQRNGDDRRE